MSSRIRQSAYKKSLVPREDCLHWSERFFETLKPLLENKNSLSEAEFAAQYVINGIRLLRPTDWRGGAHKGFSFNLTDSLAVDTFLNHSLRSIPISVNRSLYHWQVGKYPLKLYEGIPSSLEVLKMQTEGFRCVSCITDPELMMSYILDERDALSFALHDLIHADHFFRHPELLPAQIGFSQWLLKLYADANFKSWLAKDPAFEKEFFYVASDMNSHPAHLVKFFKSVMTAAILRDHGQDPREKLSEHQLEVLTDRLFECANLGGFELKFFLHLQELSTVAETEGTLSYLTRALNDQIILESTAAADNNKDGGVSFI